MPHPVQTVRLDIGIPATLDNAAQHVAWALDIDRKQVVRLALALGLKQLGAVFEADPDIYVVRRGRPRLQPDTDSPITY
ncbi:hypothetical protein FQ330_03990 [Agrococcus sediminis]|uniref:Uncharacterized protein n=1 Tax=Agrococcus sediminis TaxID=2599924 RepID=A0A5M8QIZ5_9MICO|nr:hypothetical protein [Agrococcus sediminis]KAA6434934.1 hypothetical protein FQ330_03990 [Agrococcus sediminis]